MLASYQSTKKIGLSWTADELRLYLKNISGHNEPCGRPRKQKENACLKFQAEVEESFREVQRLGLPPCPDRPKNWDSLAALDFILRNTGPKAAIFDGGAEAYSRMLPWLFLYGYENLIGGNIVFEERMHFGPIIYDHIDVTMTSFPRETLDLVTCMSVIEHGVDPKAFFREMSRILKPGGYLVVSTDYFEEAVDTRGQVAYGCPIRIFDKQGIIDLLTIAAEAGLEVTTNPELDAHEKLVHWEEYNLSYTFIILTFQKI